MSSLVGKKAPSFKANAVLNGSEISENFSLDQYLNKKYVVFFFYPKDFTFVCPTELHAFQEKLKEFESRNCAVVACSTDTEESHWGWLQMDKKAGGIKGVTYPIVADTTKTISLAYGTLFGDYDVAENGDLIATGPMIAFRGLYLIDKNGVVRHQLINDLPLGRNVDETLRMVDALQFFEGKRGGLSCQLDQRQRRHERIPRRCCRLFKQTLIFAVKLRKGTSVPFFCLFDCFQTTLYLFNGKAAHTHQSSAKNKSHY